MMKILKAAAAGMKVAAIAMLKLLVALGTLPAAVLAAAMAGAGGEDDVPEAPVADERLEEIAYVETKKPPAPAAHPYPLATAMQQYAVEKIVHGVGRARAEWPPELASWAGDLSPVAARTVAAMEPGVLQAHLTRKSRCAWLPEFPRRDLERALKSEHATDAAAVFGVDGPGGPAFSAALH